MVDPRDSASLPAQAARPASIGDADAGAPVVAGAVSGPRWRPSGLISSMVMAGVMAALAIMAATGQPGALGEALEAEFGSWLPTLVSLQFLVLAPLIFVLEYLRPARPEQRGVGPSLLVDTFYFIVHLPTIVAVATVLSSPITRFLDEHASGLVLDSTDGWPVLLVGAIGFTIADLGSWAVHLLKHKVPLFWRFHMVHHSQVRMTMFTANRSHPIDALIDVFVLLLPFYFLFPAFTAEATNVAVLVVAKGWLEKLEHANVRTNLGPLRWFLVTPQSHRIHHSTEPEHWNSNYGTFLAWDRLFGTQHRDVTSYPTTGINDPYFPEPDRWSPIEFARSIVGQMLFPFDTAAVKRASVGSPNDRVDLPS